MVNLGFTIGTITDYMHGCNGQKGLHNFSLENTVEVLAPDLFGTLRSEECLLDHLAYVSFCKRVLCALKPTKGCLPVLRFHPSKCHQNWLKEQFHSGVCRCAQPRALIIQTITCCSLGTRKKVVTHVDRGPGRALHFRSESVPEMERTPKYNTSDFETSLAELQTANPRTCTLRKRGTCTHSLEYRPCYSE